MISRLAQPAHPTFVAEGNIVLLDLRSADKASQGHIMGAVNVPMAGLPDLEDEFSARRSARFHL